MNRLKFVLLTALSSLSVACSSMNPVSPTTAAVVTPAVVLPSTPILFDTTNIIWGIDG